jgi:hypothetical protein
VARYYEAEVQLDDDSAHGLGPRPERNDRVGVNFRLGDKIYYGYAVIGTTELRPGGRAKLRLLILTDGPDDVRVHDMVEILSDPRRIGDARIESVVDGYWDDDL